MVEIKLSRGKINLHSHNTWFCRLNSLLKAVSWDRFHSPYRFKERNMRFKGISDFPQITQVWVVEPRSVSTLPDSGAPHFIQSPAPSPQPGAQVSSAHKRAPKCLFTLTLLSAAKTLFTLRLSQSLLEIRAATSHFINPLFQTPCSWPAPSHWEERGEWGPHHGITCIITQVIRFVVVKSPEVPTSTVLCCYCCSHQAERLEEADTLGVGSALFQLDEFVTASHVFIPVSPTCSKQTPEYVPFNGFFKCKRSLTVLRILNKVSFDKRCLCVNETWTIPYYDLSRLIYAPRLRCGVYCVVCVYFIRMYQ